MRISVGLVFLLLGVGCAPLKDFRRNAEATVLSIHCTNLGGNIWDCGRQKAEPDGWREALSVGARVFAGDDSDMYRVLSRIRVIVRADPRSDGRSGGYQTGTIDFEEGRSYIEIFGRNVRTSALAHELGHAYEHVSGYSWLDLQRCVRTPKHFCNDSTRDKVARAKHAISQ